MVVVYGQSDEQSAKRDRVFSPSKMVHTDGGETSSKREFSHRLGPSSPDNRVIHCIISLDPITY
jgi:hypothetical protein